MKYFASLLSLLIVFSANAQWTKQTPPTKNEEALYAVHAIDSNTVAAVGDSRIVYSNDGGATWANAVQMSQGFMHNIHWGDNAYFFIYVGPNGKGDGYEVKLKPSGGTSITTNAPTGIFGDWFHDSRTGLVCGIDGKVHQTLDGGSTWSKQISTGIGDTLVDFHFPTKSMGYVVGNNGSMAVTGNGGGVWKTLSTGIKANLRGVFFTSQNVGFAVGTGGTIIKTTNGGGTWSTQKSGVTSRLNAIALYNVNDGYAVGDNGVILETDDGGASWTQITSPTTYHLYDIHFASETKGWIVGGVTGKEEIILSFGGGGGGGGCTVSKPTAEATNISCYGETDGAVTITPVGGIAPFTYSLDGGTYGSTATFTGISYGTHYATFKDSADCESEAVTFNIVQPLPVGAATSSTDASNTTTADGTASVIASGGNPPYTYLWDDPNTQTTTTATALLSGPYTVIVTDSNGCEKSDQVTVNAGTVGLSDKLNSQILIYPNPSKGQMVLTLDREYKVEMTNLLGKKVYSKTLPKGTNKILTVHLEAGIYLMSLEDNAGNRESRKVLIEW